MNNLIIMDGIIKIKQKCGFLNVMSLIKHAVFHKVAVVSAGT